jgi:hypothetical protein
MVDDAGLLFTDSTGKRTGLDSVHGPEITEIPRSVVVQDAIDNDVTGEPAQSVAVTVHIDQPVEGTYRVLVTGAAGQKTAELMVATYRADGSPQLALRVPLDLVRTPRAEYRLRFLKGPGSMSYLERIEP